MTKEHKKEHHSSISDVVENIRKQRELMGWTQSDLAKEAGVDQSYISRLENGGRNVTLEVLDRIAHTFGIPTYELLQHKRVDEYTLRERMNSVERLAPLKRQMIEEMINAFLREQDLGH